MDFFLAFWQLFVLIIVVILPAVSLYKLGKGPLDANKKLLWCLIILFVPFLGSVAYLFVGDKTIQVSQR